MNRKPLPDTSQVLSVSDIARRFGKSRKWARALLVEWFEIQRHGGEVRVFPRTQKNRVLLFTTIAVLSRHMPPGRDEVLVHKVAELERDLDELARRIEREITARVALERKVDALARANASTQRRFG